CARMFDEKGDIVFGRIAVIPEKRHKHLGSYILHELEKKARELGYPKAKLSAQVSAMGFYEKNGFQAYGEEYLDEFCPHIHMEKRL
ncbi:MAG: GNAT family N-acetyltransferase, partial [Massilimicrobiota sp.]|nr:GNAT family N-acetyltransferase [Massilimicrobiota sp.]